ncbi:MAG: hypothetical protein ACFB4J_12615 [Elainellaceae cyanobacterium]
MAYTTEQLIRILDDELRAAWKGDRLLLSSSRLSDPVMEKALGTEKLSKVYAYRDFRSQIHQYQIEHGVSGLVQRSCRFNGQVIHFPEIHNQLVAIPRDKDDLIASKAKILAFWRANADQMPLWQLGPTRPISVSQANQHIQAAEWVEIEAGRTELYLGLCWGDPNECHYGWAYPQSRCEQVIASANEPSLLKV